MTLAEQQAAAGLRTPIRDQLFIDGRFVDAESGETLATLNPHDNSTIAEVALAGHADIDKAVAAAERAMPAWSRMAAAERGRILLKLADLLDANGEAMARLESLDTGHPLRDSRLLDVPRTAACYRYFGGMADKFQGDVVPVEAGFLNYVLREPVGVVGQIVPWNFPLMFTSWKMAPALAAGNCIVMKPAEITPLSSLKIAELMSEAGMPDGVVNIVPGLGSVAGQYIAEHERIAKIAFTGSTATGRGIVQASAGNLKKVQLELGGKGANIVFDDANLAAAVNGSAWAIFHNQGQACIAGSRLMLHEKIADEFLDRFIALAASIRLGNPLDPATEMGPLTSAQHRDRVLSYVSVAREQGGTVLAGGRAPANAELARGCYVEPTIVRVKSDRDRVAQEEVFGPLRQRCSPSATMPRRCASPTAPTTAWAAACGRATCSARTASPATCAPAWSGSTVTSGSTPARPSAASASRATDARWASRRCANTRRRRACGSTSTRRFPPGIRA